MNEKKRVKIKPEKGFNLRASINLINVTHNDVVFITFSSILNMTTVTRTYDDRHVKITLISTNFISHITRLFKSQRSR